MDEEFNWLEYSESIDSAVTQSEVNSAGRRGLRRFLPRLPRLPGRPSRPKLPGLPRVPRVPRPRLPRLPSLRRRRGETGSSESALDDLLGGQVDKPVEALDERLQALRDRSVAPAQPIAPANTALYDVDEILTAPELQRKPGGVISAAALSKAQQQQVEMLRDIVGGTADSGQSSRRSLRELPVFSLSAVPRLLGTALVLLVVSLPFVSSDYAEGELPPAVFDRARHSANTMYDLLDNITSGDYILVAFEYGPAAAGELDLLADLLLRHIFAQHAKPLVVSSNPIALVHAQNVIRQINRSLSDADAQLLHGEDYYLLRYLPGGALGLRELSENFDDVARISAKGLPTGLEFSSLEEMTEILLIADSVEDMRGWVEQVLPEAEVRRLLVATGYATQPLAQAYVDSIPQIFGPLFGIRDAYTYAEKLQSTFGGLLPEEPEIEPVPVNIASDRQKEESGEPEPTVEASLATALPLPTSTPPPTLTPFMTETKLPPTATPLPTNTPAPTATEATIRIVEVTSEQSVNIRRGPTTVDEILALGYKGDTYEVIGANGDGSWYKILLAGGLEAWIAAFLVEERTVTASEFSGAGADASASQPRERTVMQLDFTLRLGKNRPRFSQVQPPVPGDRLELILQRDRSLEIPRLEAMTLGTLAAILVIVFGNTIYAVRGLLRRRNSQGR